MIPTIRGRNVPCAYAEAFYVMRNHAVKEKSQRGNVLSIQEPVVLEILYPTERVLFDPVRNANPFFHVMEFIWMMAGRADAAWIGQFNSNILKSADKDGSIHGAYGHRWRAHFSNEQIMDVVRILNENPESRRAVIGMWDPFTDLEPGHNDYPCNTNIYFRVVDNALNMTVCNRSNDLIWGMLGANAVHMTMLQEVIAHELVLGIGPYRVFTNNLHMYTDLPNFKELWDTTLAYNPYVGLDFVSPQQILDPGETLTQFMADCREFCNGGRHYKTRWLWKTAAPIYEAYLERKRGEGDGMSCVKWIEALDWQKACREWIARKILSATLTEPLPSTTTAPTT